MATTSQPYDAPVPEPGEQPDDYKEVFDFTFAKAKLTRIHSDWSNEREATERRRKLRNIEVDNEALRQRGKLKSDEAVIPIRLIDTNIRREQPMFMAFLTKSRRLAIFKCKSNPEQNTEQLEQDFTEGMTYDGWEVDFYKTLDGSQAQGWDTVEIVFDIEKPLHVAVEHVGHDSLWFPWDSKKLQDCDLICRTYEVSPGKLKSLVKDKGFNAVEVENLLQSDKSRTTSNLGSREDKYITIHKKMCKYDGVVYVAWFSLDASDWLKAPEPLYLGRDKVETVILPPGVDALGPSLTLGPPPTEQVFTPEYETNYPYRLLPYFETEQKKITDHLGRVWLDEYKQEAIMGLASAFINGTQRASNVYGSPKQMVDAGGPAPKQTNTELVHGALYSQPLEFWNLPWPDPMMLKAADWLETQNSQETGQVSYAVNNREDSRKTATEVSTAKQDDALLKTVNVTLYSAFLRGVWTDCWRIVQNRAKNGLLQFLLVPVPTATGVSYENNVEALNQLYDLRAAGDNDVVRKQEQIMMMKQDWPVIQTTALAPMFLADYLRLVYDKGEQYAKILLEGDQKKAMIAALGEALSGLAAVAQPGAIDKDSENKLIQLREQAQQVLTAP